MMTVLNVRAQYSAERKDGNQIGCQAIAGQIGEKSLKHGSSTIRSESHFGEFTVPIGKPYGGAIRT